MCNKEFCIYNDGYEYILGYDASECPIYNCADYELSEYDFL